MKGGRGYSFPLEEKDDFLNIILSLIESSESVIVFVKQVHFLREQVRNLRDLIPALSKYNRPLIDLAENWEIDKSSFIATSSDDLIKVLIESSDSWESLDGEAAEIAGDCTRIIKLMDEISISQLDLSKYY